MNTGRRYDILIYKNKAALKWWSMKYRRILATTPSHGLMVASNLLDPSLSTFKLQDSIDILNKFDVNAGNLGYTTVDSFGSKRKLDAAITQVNDLARNQHVPWEIADFGWAPKDNSMAALIRVN